MIDLQPDKNLIKTILEELDGQKLTTMEIKKAIEEKNNCSIKNIKIFGMALKEVFIKKKFYNGVGKYTIRQVVIEDNIKDNEIENKIIITIRKSNLTISIIDSIGRRKNIILDKKYL